MARTLHTRKLAQSILRVAACAVAVLQALINSNVWASDRPVAITLDSGEFVLDPGERPPTPDAAWEPVTLPDWWGESRPGAAGIGWYRLPFHVSESQRRIQQWGVHLPKLESNAAVFMNGHWLGQGGGFAEPIGINWNRPLYFPVSATLLLNSTNYIEVRLLTHGRPNSGLAPIEVGPHALVFPNWQRLYSIQIVAGQVGSGLALFMFALFGALWAARVGEPAYGYFSLAAFFWGVHNLNYHVQEIPFGYWTWKWIVHASLDVFAVCCVLLVLRLLGLRIPRFERGILAFGAVAVVVPRFLDPAGFSLASDSFHAVSLALGFGCVALLIRHRLRLAPREIRLYGALIVVVVSLSTWDLLVQLRVLPLETIRVFHLTAILVFLVFGAGLLMRFIDAYKTAENTNELLETRVKQNQRDLAANFEQLRELEKHQAVSHERDRIMREMHDGVGSELVSALAMVEDGGADSKGVADALRDALDEMRLVIHSIDPVVGSLQTLLGSMRSRIERRLRRRELRFRWEVTDLPPTPNLGPVHYLHILRVLQEAISNAIRHAEPSVITLTTETRCNESGREGIAIRIADNGAGASEIYEPGYGIENMRHRAAQLDGRLEFTRGSEGTTVELWFPVGSEEQTTSID